MKAPSLFVLEFKKLSPALLAFVVLGFTGLPFLLTEVFVVFKRSALSGQPVELVVSNNVGSWSALLYPLLVIVLTQSVVDVERQGNLLLYGKSYRRTWVGFYGRKVAVVFTLLTLVTLLNVLFNGLLVWSVTGFMVAKDAGAMIVSASLDFLAVLLAFIPMICFHLTIALVVRKPGVAYLVGILLVILGIPIINLTDLVVNPYSFGIAALKPGIDYLAIAASGAIITVMSCYAAIWRLKK
ncbi:hypothetical protein [Neolewinella antarctica]|uniref:Uncharacterized protein n=1 Tax=Neolewinella antarctica TaxID=442734 RepID=A0ABX0XFU6_9BACT|nr:hypothetical protein [Neolewinella antarctica]NJC27648.1 hypothetical protein [Neolewinella antarctica]